MKWLFTLLPPLSIFTITLSACGLVVGLVTAPLRAIAPKNTYIVQEGKDITPNDTQINGIILSKIVVRIECEETAEAGTGFLHVSGLIITAGHLVRHCRPQRTAIKF